ncbi:unnamed protein product [Adineta steineri]|uniref:G-protein coupled receptors family 1 profile domain-containing protein n=1 Tax=Adineta steineri TaxID=433720 RepID=A0A819UGE9_9BILA|nr:unnamed protein product [Adineta steineri]
MSSEYDFISKLLLIQKSLYQFGGPILVLLGTISCTLSLIVFTKKNLRKSPCSIYFAAMSISNLILIYISVLITILQYGYNIVPATYNLPFCRFTVYATFVLDTLSPFYLILASIDRVLITSSNARTRQRSTFRLAWICVIVGTLFWIIVHIHALVFGGIIEEAPNYFICYFQLGAYFMFTGYYTFITQGILVPFLLIIFGLWSIKNIRTMSRRRIAPVLSTTGIATGNDSHPIQAKDRQLVLILLIDICVYMIFGWMFPIFLIYQQTTQYNVKSLVQSQIEILISAVSIFIYFIPTCIGCYTNILVSKTFRNEVKNTLLCK